VELLDGSILGGNGGNDKLVSTLVTLMEAFSESGSGMQRLVNVTHIMNEQSQVEAVSQVPGNGASV